MTPSTLSYDLASLFDDQPEWFARETIPHVLAWVDAVRSPVVFTIERSDDTLTLKVSWSRRALASRIQELRGEVRRLREGRSVMVEQTPQYAAYGLAGILASLLLKERIVEIRRWLPPDLLFDSTPTALRGIEVAGRSQRGLSGLRELANEKIPGLKGAPGVREAWLSLWCSAPCESLLLKVVP